MMPGTPVKVGPFVGGLNTFSDASAIGDNEVASLVNFDVDLDGSLVSRPPFVQFNAGTGANNNLFLLGYFRWTDGNNYLLASNSNGLYYFLSGVWTLISTQGAGATAYVQYQNKAWIATPQGSANSGFSWDPTGGGAGTLTSIANMPKGSSAIIYKERMFIAVGSSALANTSRLYFSQPGDLSNATGWPSSNFIDVRSGDGQDIVDICIFQDTIVVFKTASTYIFAYDSSPAKGSVRIVSPSIGIGFLHCWAVYENSLVVYHNGSVYAVTNWQYEKLNIKVPFAYINAHVSSNTIGVTVSLLGDRVVVRYYDSYYVFGMKTRAWTTWSSSILVDQFIKNPVFDSTTGMAQYFAGSCLNTVRALYSFKDGYTLTDSESMACSVRTKTMDFNIGYAFKRLFWWGSDVLTKVSMGANVTPVAYTTQVTWNDLLAHNWGDLLGHSWQQPLSVTIDVSDSISISNASGARQFLRWLKSLRFRQVNFSLNGTVTGISTDSPIRIFSLTAYVTNHENVPKKIN